MITYLDRVCFGTVAPFIQEEFRLDDKQMGLLFTAFAFAYALFEMPSGWLGDVFGPRKTLIRIVLWWSLFTSLTGAIYPNAFGLGFAFVAMLLVRFLFGMGEAGAYPNIARAFYNWFPFGERGSAQGAVWMAGRFAGGLSAYAVLILVYKTIGPDGGVTTHWRHCFWIFGLLGVVWCGAFWWWFRDRPEQHRGVNPAELALIRGTRPAASAPPGPPSPRARAGASTAVVTGSARTGLQEGPGPLAFQPEEGPVTAQSRAESVTATTPSAPAPSDGEGGHAGVPWGRMLTSVNLWALCLMYFCASYGWYFNITWLPTYLKTQYGVTKDSHGVLAVSFLSGAPLLFGALACLVGGLLTDAFIRRTGDRKWGRRLFGVLGHGVCAVCYFLSLAASSPWLFVAAITLATFCNDLTMGSAWASCLDIGRKYSGIVSGCMNTVGNMGGAAAGITTGVVLARFPAHGWTINFVSYGAVYVAAMLLWLRFDATRPLAPEG
jgi:MFS family permease